MANKKRTISKALLASIRSLVKKNGLGEVNRAIKSLYDERKAEKELVEAERKVQALKRRMGI